MLQWIAMLGVGSVLASEPAWPVSPPRQTPPDTLQEYVDRSEVVLHVRVDHLEPFDLEDLEVFTATEVHMVVIEALKGSAPDNDVWVPFPDRFAETWRPVSTLGTELLVFATSAADRRPASAHALDILYTGVILRNAGGLLTYTDGSSVYLVGPEKGMRIGLVPMGEARTTWSDLIVETRIAVKRSTATNAIVIGSERP